MGVASALRLPEQLAPLLNRWTDRIELLTILTEEPHLEDLGILEPGPELETLLAEERRRLSGPGRYNEVQAVLGGDVRSTTSGEVVIPFHQAEYALISSLRRAGRPPFVVSACVLLTCDSARTLFVQRRSAFCDLAPGSLHTFSGAHRPGDRRLWSTARREVSEETGVSPASAGAPVLLMRESISCSLQYVVLGAEVREIDLPNLSDSVEGSLVAIKYDDLGRHLMERHDAWAETGWCHILAWLLLAAGPEHSRFGDVDGPELARRVLAVSKE